MCYYHKNEITCVNSDSCLDPFIIHLAQFFQASSWTNKIHLYRKEEKIEFSVIYKIDGKIISKNDTL